MGAPQSQSEPWRGLKGERKAGQGSGSWPAFFNIPFLSCQWRAPAPPPFLPPRECLGVSSSLPVLTTTRQDVFRDPSAKKRYCASCQSWRLLLTGEET